MTVVCGNVVKIIFCISIVLKVTWKLKFFDTFLNVLQNPKKCSNAS